MKECLERVGAVPIALVYDGIYFRPMGLDLDDQAFVSLVSRMEEVHGITVRIKDLTGAKLKWRQPASEVDEAGFQFQGLADSGSEVVGLPHLVELCEVTAEPIIKVRGSHMCAPAALTNMNLASGEPSQAELADGPYTYKQLQQYYHLSVNHVVMEELLCADACSTFLLHVGKHGDCGHAVGLVSEAGSNNFLVYDANQDVVLRIGDEILYDLANQYDTTPRRCWLLQVTEDEPQDRPGDVGYLEMSAGAPNKMEAYVYDFLVAALSESDRAFDDVTKPSYSNSLRKLGINMVQERASVAQRADAHQHLHHATLFRRICVSKALHQHGLGVQVVQDGPEWIAKGGSEMLQYFGLCVRQALPEELQRPGRFVIDDGAGHAFALYVGDYVIISFQSGTDQFMTTTALDSLLDATRAGDKQIYGIYSLDTQLPFLQGRWTPPWVSLRSQDSLCGAEDEVSLDEGSSDAESDDGQPDLGKELLSSLRDERSVYEL